MIATSRSGRSHPGIRPVAAAFVPEIHSVQSPLLSSIHRPAPFLRTIWLTFGGVRVTLVFITGEKLVPPFGGGSAPPCGPCGSSTGPGAGALFRSVNRCPNTVVPLPDSKIATYTCEPSGLVAIARGRSPSIAIFVTARRVTGSITNTAFVRMHETHARNGFPAKTRSLAPAGVSNVASTRRDATFTILIDDEM